MVHRIIIILTPCLSFVHDLCILNSTTVLRTASAKHHNHWADNLACWKLAHGDPREYVSHGSAIWISRYITYA